MKKAIFLKQAHGITALKFKAGGIDVLRSFGNTLHLPFPFFDQGILHFSFLLQLPGSRNKNSGMYLQPGPFDNTVPVQS